MRIIGGIAYEDGRLNISFASLRRGNLALISTYSRKIDSEDFQFFSIFEEYFDEINDCILELEKRYSCRVADMYVCLPYDCVDKVLLEDTVVIDIKKRKKRIEIKDIVYAKRHIEKVALNWDDVVVHHLIQGCDVNGREYSELPLGVWADKVTFKSLIITVKSHIYDKFFALFDNVGKDFGGFVYEPLAEYGCFISDMRDVKNPISVVHIQSHGTRIVSFYGSRLVGEELLPVGESDIVKSIANKFLVGEEVAERILFHYGSLRDMHLSKDISVRSRGGYVNVSLMSLNILLRDSLRGILEHVLEYLKKNVVSSDVKVSFLGRITHIEGFLKLVQETVPFKMLTPFTTMHTGISSGCVRYGVYKFLETFPRRENIFQKAIRAYREYF